MKKYILIAVLTLIIVFVLVYVSDYVKDTYFDNCIEDFKGAYTLIKEKFENDDALTAKYKELLKSRDDKALYGDATKQEVSFGAEMEKYKTKVYDKYETINDPIGDEYMPYRAKNYRTDPAAISNNNLNEYTIINVYKSILDRQPTDKELNRNLQDFYENDLNEDILKLRIYNSTEYKIITNMQSNDIKPEMVANISKGHLKDKLKKLYKDQHNTELTNTRILDILVKCYVHLQFNDYLFRAMLMHDKYNEFEYNIRKELILSDNKLLEIFDNSFLLYELRLIANELKRQDVLKRDAMTTPVSLHQKSQSELNTSNINVSVDSEKHFSEIIKNSDNVFNINIMLNDKNDNMSSPYARDELGDTQYNQDQLFEQNQLNDTIYSLNQLYSQQYLNDNNQNNISELTGKISELTGNISNMSDNIPSLTGNIPPISGIGSGGSGGSAGQISSSATTSNISSSIITSNITTGIITSNVASSNINTSASNNNASSMQQQMQQQQMQQILQQQLLKPDLQPQQRQDIQEQLLILKRLQQQRLQDNMQLRQPQQQQQQSQQQKQSQQQQQQQKPATRVYNPIDYKQNYRGDMRYRPSVCSYGTKQIVQPIFLNSSTLFQGTDLKEAAENTQVGSIMPKFEYYEYEDIKR
jgi:hypothetical protein